MTHRHIRRLRAAVGRLGGDDGGTASVSFAMVFPVLLGLVFLLVQGGMWWWARDVAQTAAREGASAGRAYSAGATTGSDEAQQILDQYGNGLTIPDGDGPTEQRTATTVTVTVTVAAQSIIPLPGGLTITTSFTSPREVWVNAGG